MEKASAAVFVPALSSVLFSPRHQATMPEGAVAPQFVGPASTVKFAFETMAMP